MSQHTPGPWNLNGSTISGRDPLDLRGNYNESPVCTISHGWRNSDIDSANARLIAKAPEMYELLLLLTPTLYGCRSGHTFITDTSCDDCRKWEKARTLLREIEEDTP